MPGIVVGDEKFLCVFLQAIDNPRSMIWCSRNGVVVKILKGFVSSMMSNLIVADGKNFTNKSLHSTASTRISFAGVPGEVATKFSGYRCVFF